MVEGHTGELRREAEEIQTITLNPKEAKKLVILLNIELRKAEAEVDFFGTRTERRLAQKEAVLLNEVFKQLAGRDHDVYERRFGSTMPATDKPVRPVSSNKIRIAEKERSAVSSLVNQELNDMDSRGRRRSLNPNYEQVLLNLEKKLSVRNQPLPPKS